MKDFEIVEVRDLEYQISFIGDMPDPGDTARALEITIGKWHTTAKFWESHPEATSLHGLGTETCGLCMIYWTPRSSKNESHGQGACPNCPIAKAEGIGWCIGTPFSDYLNNKDGADVGLLAALAWREYNYLVKLARTLGIER